MEISLRLENEEDYYTVEKLTREAFWEMPDRPHGCFEHYLVRKIRQCSDFIKELSYVALNDSIIVGHIIYFKSKIIDSNNNEHEIISFGPVSVFPDYQRKGIGTKLIEFTLERAKTLGYRAVMIYGHSDYYPRFGFINAKKFKITTPEGENFDTFMICELQKNSLNGIIGRGYQPSIFDNVTEEEIMEYDKIFPKKPGTPCFSWK